MYAPPAAPPPSSRKALPAWVIGLLAGFATLIVAVGVGFVMVFFVKPIPGAEFERGERLGRGTAPLSLLVGLATGLSVRLVRRSRAARVGGR